MCRSSSSRKPIRAPRFGNYLHYDRKCIRSVPNPILVKTVPLEYIHNRRRQFILCCVTNLLLSNHCGFMLVPTQNARASEISAHQTSVGFLTNQSGDYIKHSNHIVHRRPWKRHYCNEQLIRLEIRCSLTSQSQLVKTTSQ